MNTQSSSSKKPIVIILIVAVVAGFVYFGYLGGSAPSSSSSLLVQTVPDAQAEGTRVLSLLNQIKSLRIDASVFNDPAFKSLRDFSVQIPADNVGRANPFAPLPGVKTTAAAH